MRKMKLIASIKVKIDSSLKLSMTELITLDVICLLDKLISLSIFMVYIVLFLITLFVCNNITKSCVSAVSAVSVDTWHNYSTPKFGTK